MYKKFTKRLKNENHITFCGIALLLILFAFKTQAQSLGDPIVNITFGSGTASHAGALPADSGSTSYTYSSADFPSDGSYTIEKTTNTPGTWWTTTDHTGNTNGYMMVVNASVSKTDYFYKRQVTSLCGATTYQFSAWVGNLLRYNDISPPNITFSIETTDGTVIQSYTTGTIPRTSDAFHWLQFTFNFTLPATVTTVVIKMSNNSNGGAPANDLALDDITFRPYGAQVTAVLDQSATNETFCAGTVNTVNVNTTSALPAGYAQKLQMLVNGTWVDQSAASTATSFPITTPILAGTYYYRIVSGLTDNVGSSNCVVSSNQVTLTVTAAATAAITAPDVTCLGSTTAFTDASTANGGTITGWLWNFGDGQTSTLQNPTHIYTTAGSKIVTLNLTNSSGCTSAPASKTIFISSAPVAAFTASTPDCDTRAVTFTDASTSAEGTIVKWLWDYGDGTVEEKTNNQAVQHTYATTGSYNVSLVITNDKGCSGSAQNAVTISPLPKVDFTIPPVCIGDAYASFNDATTIADNSNSSFTYLWNFGDDNATAQNPNTSALQNPTHRYSAAKQYTATLTVTSGQNCAVTVSKTFNVNGAIPVAAFTPSSTTECSNREVFFTNQSTVDFGDVTKVIIYFDYGNDRTIAITDDSPYFGKVYRHTYPEFHTPASKTYTVHMDVYSGSSLTACNSSAEKTITLLATPEITFTAPADICIDAGTIQLTATKTDGPAGSGVFSGTGVSAAGVFDPAVSGTGTFPIQYIYTSANACADTVTQSVTVGIMPTVTAGPDFYVLEGTSVVMPAKATPASGVTYLWSPATGLNRTDVLNPTVTLTTSDVTYTITVTTANGCTATSQVKVSLLRQPVIPNTFTPNGDGTNDTWEIKYLDTYPNCTVDIFNRNGQKVFSSIGYPKAWDGRYNGQDLPVGAYYYVINPKLRPLLSGSVTIIR